jgi:hypothetical protein
MAGAPGTRNRLADAGRLRLRGGHADTCPHLPVRHGKVPRCADAEVSLSLSRPDRLDTPDGRYVAHRPHPWVAQGVRAARDGQNDQGELTVEPDVDPAGHRTRSWPGGMPGLDHLIGPDDPSPVTERGESSESSWSWS